MSFIANYALSVSNGPNYWGDSYPGHLTNRDYYYQHPKDPSEYKFGGSPSPSANSYDGSHYGTHDWLADAAIRSLRDPLKNPIGFGDWTWLINSEIVKNKWPMWNPDYGNDAQHHNKRRSYFTYLFATQMPDMRIRSDMSEERKNHYPQRINIPKEGVIIEDFHPQTDRRNKWVGQIQQHTFHFHVVNMEEYIFGFAPYKILSATKAKQLGEAAIGCIGNKVKNEEGDLKSAMQPEGASGWLGAMTHYIADIMVPAHILEHQFYEHVYSNKYHDWFENQLASLTKWNKVQGSHGGPETMYFSWEIGIIGKTGMIKPLPPEIAVSFMAVQAINIAYRTDGNHQHIELNKNNDDEARNSGLYLNNEEKQWDWKVDLETNGRAGSSHKYFYEKVEKLLCWANYYIACAMQYCMNEGKEKSADNSGLNPDYWVTRDPNDMPRQPPDPNPEDRLDDLDHDSIDSISDRFSRIFKNLGLLIAPILIGIANMLQKTFHLIGR